MKVASCGIHGFHETIGLDVDEIRVFWTLESEEYSVQNAYRVVIATSEHDLYGLVNSTFDTGRISTDQQRNILCKPRVGFRSTCNYYWRVTVWDADDVVTYSEVQTFFTAYPRSPEVYATLKSDLPYMVRRYREQVEGCLDWRWW
jgi:hypothetical protein